MPAVPSSLNETIALVRALESAGDFLEAHETAMMAREIWPDDPTLRFRAVLTLARAGTTAAAIELYDTLKLGAVECEDERALRGRLEKDRALARHGDARQQTLRAAAAWYAEAHAFGHGAFSAVNAATLFFLAGDAAASAEWRERALKACAVAPANNDIDRYWRDATRAEAYLLAGDNEAAGAALADATALPRDIAAWASTRRQLALILAAQGRDEAILAPLRLPASIHYLGHMISPPGVAGRFPAECESRITAEIEARLDRHDAGFLCGSLACGADILFAEAALRRKIELHVVLPFRDEDFLRLSVARGGPGWKARFDACLEAGTSKTWATAQPSAPLSWVRRWHLPRARQAFDGHPAFQEIARVHVDAVGTAVDLGDAQVHEIDQPLRQTGLADIGMRGAHGFRPGRRRRVVVHALRHRASPLLAKRQAATPVRRGSFQPGRMKWQV
jgi:tetratricopeptide (TPR) repeat protein